VAKRVILYITDTEGMGGAELYLQTLFTHVDRSRYQVGLVLPPRAATQPLVEAAQRCGVAVHYLESVHRHGLSLRKVYAAARLLRQLRPDVVHFVLPSPRRCAEIVVAAWLARVPRRLATFQLVTGLPRSQPLSRPKRGLNRRWQYGRLSAGIAVSTANYRLLLEQHRFPARRLQLVFNSVDTERFQPRAAGEATGGQLRQIWGVPAGAPLLGVIGRLSYQKGHAILFAALPQIWAAHPDAHVVLVGSGDLEQSLREQARALPGNERIHFVGQHQDIAAAMAELDIFVLPSLFEGLSLALLEAMALALPVVATAADGTTDALVDGQSGLVVPPGQAAPLAAAISRMLADPALRQRLGQAARAAALERFQQATMLERTFALYEAPARPR